MMKRSRSVLLALQVALLSGVFLSPPTLAQGPKINDKNPTHVSPGELTNPLLSPRLAQWLVGPVSWMLSQEERDQFLFMSDDAEAEAFIARFWEKHADVKDLFDERVAEADKKFRERTFKGYRSDRGIVYVLFGPPEKERYEEHRDIIDGDVELWEYPKDALPGLNGQKPLRVYRFSKEEEQTVFFRKDRRRDAQRRIKDRSGIPRPF
jgi:GWxTD domain-containing protein